MKVMYKKNQRASGFLDSKKSTNQEIKYLQAENIQFWKKIFLSIVVLASAVLFISGWGTGFHSDEMDQNAYGKAVINYYTSLGDDTTFLNLKLEDGVEVAKEIKTYGALFDVGFNLVTRAMGLDYEYDVRHLLIQLIGVLTMVLCSLIVKQITGGYQSALMAFILIFCTPTFFGHSLMNSRDIPFAFGYTLGLYSMIKFFRTFDLSNYKSSLMLGISIGISMTVRIGGLILFVPFILMVLYQLKTDKQWAGFFSDFSNYKKLIVHCVFIFVFPLLFAVISHPFILRSPIDHFLICISTAKKFPNRIPINFDGYLTDSLHIPKSYLWTWMGITLPLVVLVFVAIGVLFFCLKYRQLKSAKYVVLVFISVFFPLGYAIQNNFALYTGWRHLLFIYPGVVVLASYFLEYVKFKSRALNYLIPVFLLLALFHPIKWMIKNHPFQYVYFNEVSGGFEENYYKFETDGWQLSVKKAVEWLVQQKDMESGQPIIIGTNAYSATKCLLRSKYKMSDTGVVNCGFKAKNVTNWRYLILNVNFMSPDYLKTVYPNIKATKTIEIDGKPVCIVVRDTLRNDYRGYQSLNNGHFEIADSLLSLSIREEPHSENLLILTIISKMQSGKFDEANQFCVRGLDLYPENATLHYYRACCLYESGKYEQSISEMKLAADYGLAIDKDFLVKLAILCKKTGNTELEKQVLMNLKGMEGN